MPSGETVVARSGEDSFEDAVVGCAARSHWEAGHLSSGDVVRTLVALEGAVRILEGFGYTAEDSVVRGSGHNFDRMLGCHKPVGHKFGHCYSDRLVHHPSLGIRSRRELDQELACLGQNSPILGQGRNKSPSV